MITILNNLSIFIHYYSYNNRTLEINYLLPSFIEHIPNLIPIVAIGKGT